jgi:type II secretory pathway component GspD/PulD (secretin)
MHYISVDDRSNTVLVIGPADKTAQADAVLKKIDSPQPKDQRPLLVGPPRLNTYSVPGGNAEVVAKNLQEIYKSVPGIRVAAVSNHSIMVWAGPNDQAEILVHIRSSREQTSTPEVIALVSLDASDVVDTLKGMFGTEAKNGAPYLKADTSRNAVVVKGSPDQLNEIKFALKALGEGGAPPLGGTMRVFTIEPGNAAPVAETLKRMLPQMLQNPIQVITPGGNGSQSSESRQ